MNFGLLKMYIDVVFHEESIFGVIFAIGTLIKGLRVRLLNFIFFRKYKKHGGGKIGFWAPRTLPNRKIT